MPWIAKTILAFFLLGIMQFCFKLSAQKSSIDGAFRYLAIQATVILGIVFIFTKLQSLKWKIEFADLGAGIFGGIALMFYFLALEKEDVSRVTPIFSQKFLLTSSMGIILLNEGVNFGKVLGLVLGALSLTLLLKD